MLLKTILIPLFMTLFMGLAAQAGTIPFYYWDNQNGFVPAQHCEISRTKEHRFRISTYFGPNQEAKTENLRNFSGVRQSHLINGSLVKLIDGKEKRDFKKIEVVGVNQDPDVEPNRWFSQRLDQGYLYYSSLLPVEDFIIKLTNISPSQQKMGKTFSNVEGFFLKIASESTFFKMDCPEFDQRDYVIFKVYKKHSHHPSALVGVYWDETKLFKNIRTATKYDAISILPNNLSEESLTSLLSNNGSQVEVRDDETTVEDDVTDEVDQGNDEDDTTSLDDSNDSLDGMTNVVCTANSHLNVRDASLNDILFTAQRGEQVKIFQGWGDNTKKKVIDGVEYVFKKVQFADREGEDQTIGFVAYNFIKPKSKCKFFFNDQDGDQTVDTQITGLDDPNCCEFPTVKRPTHRYDSGMRKFGAGRSRGKRLHAACDLYRFKMEPILSVAPGKVVRSKYYFYQGTYAIEVVHSGGFVVRYGELDKKSVSGITKGAKLKMGQRIGYMGKVNSNCCRPMLHFELYDGSLKGPLSTKGNKYQRRGDLMDPTPYLYKWEHENF